MLVTTGWTLIALLAVALVLVVVQISRLGDRITDGFAEMTRQAGDIGGSGTSTGGSGRWTAGSANCGATSP